MPKTDNDKSGDNVTNIIINLSKEEKKEAKRARTPVKKKKKKTTTKKKEKERGTFFWSTILLLLILSVLCVFLIRYCHKKYEESKGGGATPLWDISENGKYLDFGYYPKTVVTTAEVNSITATNQTDGAGYYLDELGNRYKKATADSSIIDSTYSDGTPIQGGLEYYFKVEKIRWRILEKENNVALLLSENILDAHEYRSKQISDISEWLNANSLCILTLHYYYILNKTKKSIE